MNSKSSGILVDLGVIILSTITHIPLISDFNIFDFQNRSNEGDQETVTSNSLERTWVVARYNGKTIHEL